MEQRLEILFKEYDTLRAEIISRINNIFQMLGFSGALSAVFLPFLWSRELTKEFWISIVLIALVIFSFWMMIHIEIGKAAARIREIERAVNVIAGDELLKWETHWGRAQSWVINWLIERKDR